MDDVNDLPTPRPWQLYKEEIPVACGLTVTSTSIHTEWEHAQLKGPAPIVTLGTSVMPENETPRRAVHTIYIRDADAKFIVKACNAYDGLCESLKALLIFNKELCEDIGVSTHYPSAEKARRALLQLGIDLDDF